MNISLAAGIGALIYSLWLVVLFLIPKPEVDWIYQIIASCAVGWWIGMFYSYLRKGSLHSQHMKELTEAYQFGMDEVTKIYQQLYRILEELKKADLLILDKNEQIELLKAELKAARGEEDRKT